LRKDVANTPMAITQEQVEVVGMYGIDHDRGDDGDGRYSVQLGHGQDARVTG